MSRTVRALIRDRDGAVILEASLMIAIILLLTFGMIDFGRVMYTSNSLISSAREGARYGAVESPVVAAKIDSVVRKRFNSFTFGGDTLTDGAITVVDSSANVTPSVQVSIAYTFRWISPVASIASLIARGSVSYRSTLHAQARYRYEQ